MARVISICNAKGGVGKTTTATGLSCYLAALGRKTLLIDFDPQANASSGLGVKADSSNSVYHGLMGLALPESLIKNTLIFGFEVIPASQDLAGALVELVSLEEREYRLRKLVNQFRHRYDFILIDLPPSLNLLTINGLLASDEVLIPIQCEYYSLEGLGQLLKTIDLIRGNLGYDLKIGGALLTMFDRREKLSREVAKEVRRHFPYKVYEVEIPRSVSLAEAPSFGKPIILHAPNSPGAAAYERLAREIIGESENQPQPAGGSLNF